MIHAWLDDALDAPAAAGLAAHVAGCAECTGRVAEARGLIAGASRIVAALDELPAGTRPAWAQASPLVGAAPAPVPVPAARQDASLWRWLRVTPARAAIAATLIVALGITMTRTRSGPDSVEMKARSEVATDAASASASAPAPASSPARADGLLDSAIARNLAQTQPPRSIEAARAPTLPAVRPEAATRSAPGLMMDSGARMQVAEGRRAEESRREVGADAVDKVRVRGAAVVGNASPLTGAVASAPLGIGAVEPKQSQSIMARKADIVGSVASSRSDAVANCYLLESSTPGATWANEPFPIVVSADSAARAGSAPVRVLSRSGRATSIGAMWVKGPSDSLTLRLRGSAFAGSIVLGPDLGGRAGLARSSASEAFLENLVVTGAGDSAPRAALVTPAPVARSAPAAPPAEPANAVSQARVTMRPIACPAG